MSDPRFIFNTVDYQNSANSFNNYVNTVNTISNAPVTGNTFKFQTDADRMKYLIGTKGQSRSSGYYDGFYLTLYKLTVVQNGSTLPSINGPGNAGWGQLLWQGPIQASINIEDNFLTTRTGQGDYVGIQIAGYIYSPVATTVTFQTVTDDGGAVYLNGNLVLNAWAYQGPTTTTSGLLNLNAGYNPIRILFFEGAVTCIFKFSYTITGGTTQSIGCDCFYNYANL